MEYRRLGRSGLKVSALSLGNWVTFAGVLGRSEARELVAQAFDAGINLFDSAESHAHGAAESLLGDVLADLRLPRDAFCVSSKAYFGASPAPRPSQRGLSRKHLREACDAALRRLRVDYLDLFFCHRPDPETPLDETIAAMDQLVAAGKVLYWGMTEWTAERITQAELVAGVEKKAAPSAAQARYNLLDRERIEREYAELHAHSGLGLIVGSPLASGLLSGKYAAGGMPPDSRLRRRDHGWRPQMMYGQAQAPRERAVQRLLTLAAQAGIATATLAIAWCLRNRAVSSVVLGCSNRSQLQANLEALEVYAGLDPVLLQQLDGLLEGGAGDAGRLRQR